MYRRHAGIVAQEVSRVVGVPARGGGRCRRRVGIMAQRVSELVGYSPRRGAGIKHARVSRPDRNQRNGLYHAEEVQALLVG